MQISVLKSHSVKGEFTAITLCREKSKVYQGGEICPFISLSKAVSIS